MGKQVKITEEELHSLIKSKILEAVEDIKKLGKNLGYAPAIGNKKRGPGDEIEDQMTKRKNKKLDEEFDEVQGTHDKSQLYDDVYKEIEPSLGKWGAGPVYGWKGNQGVCFSVKGNKWITITMMGFNGFYNDDSFFVTISQYGTDDPEDADKFLAYVNLYDLKGAITQLVRSQVNEGWKPIYRRLPDGDMDYDGDEWDGGPNDYGDTEIELSNDAMLYAIEKVTGIKFDESYAKKFAAEVGEEPNVDDFIDDMMRKFGFDGMVTVNLDFNVSNDKGDYWTPPSCDVNLNNWEISSKCPYYSEASDTGKKIMQVAADYEMDNKDANELFELINESATVRLTQSQVHKIIKESVKRVLRENKMWDAMTNDMRKFAAEGKDVYDFLEYAAEKYGIDEEQFYASGGYEVWCDFTGEDPMSYEY